MTITTTFTIPGHPIGKPRMTRRDKWARRPCVLEYRAWADSARLALYRALNAANNLGAIDVNHKMRPGLYEVSWVAYIGMADTWSKKNRLRLENQLHFGKPDRDNIDKALLDSLFGDDRGVCSGRLLKYWDDGQGPRLVVTINPIMGEMP